MWDYTDKVKDYFLNPKNVGVIDDADGVGEVGSLACGDALKLTFKLGSDGKIEDAKFQTFGCASAIASSSALTEMLKGKTIKEAEKITNEDISDYLGGLPKAKMHCSVMGQDALSKAIVCYRGEKEKLIDEGDIVCKCFGVTNVQIRKLIEKKGIDNLDDITSFLKAGGGCASCHDEIKKIIEEVNGVKLPSIISHKKLTTLKKIKMIEATLEKDIRPALIQDGGDIDLIDVDGNNVFIKLRGACASCSKSKITLKHYVETKFRELVSPDLIVKEV